MMARSMSPLHLIRKSKDASRAEIRHAVPGDVAEIRTVERVAFTGDEAARLVDRLRDDGDGALRS